MSELFEGDLIRPLGLVTLYSAYAEREIDELVLALSTNHASDEKAQRWPVGRKLTLAIKLVRDLRADCLMGLISTLNDARALFESRNALVHGCIFGGRLVSNRSSVNDRPGSSKELLDLAERIFSCKEHICMYRQWHLFPLLNRGESQDGT